MDATGDEVTTTLSRRVGILLTHDCEFDKPRVDFVLMAWVRRLEELTAGTQANVRAGRMRSTFYLPACPLELPESFVDLYHIVPVRKVEIERIAREGQRVASLSDDARLALQRQIAIYFGHARAEAQDRA